MTAFEQKQGLRRVLGAIDGFHISVSAPLDSPESYVNRKGFHSLVLQVVCDDQLIIRDAITGWPGSVHDARVYRNSDLFHRIQANPATMCPEGSYLIGDAGYPLSEQMITPFKGQLNPEQANFNFAHSSTRMVVEKTFAILKGRFRCLKNLDVKKIDSCLCSHSCSLHVT